MGGVHQSEPRANRTNKDRVLFDFDRKRDYRVLYYHTGTRRIWAKHDVVSMERIIPAPNAFPTPLTGDKLDVAILHGAHTPYLIRGRHHLQLQDHPPTALFLNEAVK